MMAEGTFELHPGDALYPETVLELSDLPQPLYVRGNVWSCRGRACGEGGG